MYLVDENFVKSIPEHKEEMVFGKMKQLVEQLEEHDYDFSAIPFGASVRSVGDTDLWKFRINRGDRIVFAFLSADATDLKGLRSESLEHRNIFFLKYCSHDEAIRYSNRLQISAKNTIVMDDNEDEVVPENEDDGLDQYLYDWYCDYEYESQRNIIKVVPAEDMGRLAHLDKNEILYYLSDEQAAVLREPLPIFLFGCAGSGKTTLNIRELEKVCLSEQFQSVGYFTYSPLLRDDVKSGLSHILYTKGNQEKFEKVRFWDFREFLSAQNNSTLIVHYEEFREWYERSIRKKYDSFAVWREIRGIIKGMFGVEWNVSLNRKGQKLMGRDEYLSLGSQYSVFGHDEKYEIYEIAEQYQMWLDNKKKYDDNDLTMILLKQRERLRLLRYDGVVIDEIQDLTEIEIFLLYKLAKNPYKVFWSGDSNQTVNATYFQPHRLKSLFMKDHHILVRDPERILTLNYRCAPPIVALANRIIQIRCKALRKDKCDQKFDYIEKAVHLETGTTPLPIHLTYSSVNEELLLSLISERHYAAVLVADSLTKEALQKRGFKHIYTVAEFKGIEREFILCYGIISSHDAEWRRVYDNQISKDDLYRFRYYFNQLYVAITRARQGVCFLDDVENPFYEQLENCMVTTDSLDLVTKQLKRQSTQDDYAKTALYLEKAEHFEAAIEMYVQADDTKGAERCQFLFEYQKGNYKTAADGLFRLREYRKSLDIYTQIADQMGIIRCRLMLKQDYESILSNAEDELTVWHAAFDGHDVLLAKVYIHAYNKYMDAAFPKVLNTINADFQKNTMRLNGILSKEG